MGSAKHSDAESKCPAHQDSDPSIPEQAKTGKNMMCAVGVGGGVGLAAAAAGLIWHFVEPTTPAQRNTTKSHVAPALTQSFAGLSVSGAF